MNKKYFLLTSFIVTTFAILCISFLLFKESRKKAFNYKLFPITAKNFNDYKPKFEELKILYSKAFLPVAYSTDKRLIGIPDSKKELVKDKVIQGIFSEWDVRTVSLKKNLENNSISKIFLIVAKNNNDEPVGFALFKDRSLGDYLGSKLIRTINKSKDFDVEALNKTNHVHLSILSVDPKYQGKGIGKELVFSILRGCPNIEYIYLTTAASNLNKKAQGFYEHIGFKKLLTGEFKVNLDKLDPEKIVYVYRHEIN